LGFTLTEVIVASAVSVLVIGGAMGAFIQGLQVWQQEQIKNELNFNLEHAMEWIRTDLRLSSVGIGLMAFYPPDSNDYTAISLPIAQDVDNDGLLDRDQVTDKIVWNRTVIYHVRPGTPDQLVRTVFNNRLSNATPSQIYQQLANVVQAPNDAAVAAAALTGETVTSRVIFENLVNLRFRPPSCSYDQYATERFRAGTFNWGSIVLDSGIHTLLLTVKGKNEDSTGYGIEVDDLSLSPSGSWRDGERFLPTRPQSTFTYGTTGGTATAIGRDPGQGWVGGGVMSFVPTGLGSKLRFDIYNDLWCDNNFDDPSGVLASNCSVKYDTSWTSSAPYIPDFVVTMDKGIAWTASSCADSKPATTFASLTTMTNYIYGSTNMTNYTIWLNGRWAKVYFEREPGCSLLVTNAKIRSVATGVSSNLTFSGKNWIAMSTNGPIRTNSDWVPMWEIDKDKNYIVSYQTRQVGGDNDLDLFTAVQSNPGRIRCWSNEGSAAVFDLADLPVNDWEGLTTDLHPAPYFGDIDGDGDEDMFVGDNSSILFFRNNGTSKVADFDDTQKVPNWLGVSGYSVYVPCVKDLDGDGDLDVVAGSIDGKFIYVKNTGCSTNAIWASPVYGWKVFDLGDASAPELADIDNDGDLDLLSGCAAGNIYQYRNDGPATNPTFVFITSTFAGVAAGTAGTYTVPRFADTDGDGDLDLYVGSTEGNLYYYQNNGGVWAAGVIAKAGCSVSRCAPAFVNIDRDTGAPNTPARWANGENVVMSVVNGLSSTNLYGVAAVEVGYPRFARYRSGIFDTRCGAPVWNRLNWTMLEYSSQGDVDVRIRSSNDRFMGDLTDADFKTAYNSGLGYVQSPNYALTTLPKKRYVQYEVSLTCGVMVDATMTPFTSLIAGAHTNKPTAVLRDLTVDWPGVTGLVDLNVGFGRGPDLGIVDATVDGQSFIKGVVVEMEIFKAGRTGTNMVSGVLELRPLNTGK